MGHRKQYANSTADPTAESGQSFVNNARTISNKYGYYGEYYLIGLQPNLPLCHDKRRYTICLWYLLLELSYIVN